MGGFRNAVFFVSQAYYAQQAAYYQQMGYPVPGAQQQAPAEGNPAGAGNAAPAENPAQQSEPTATGTLRIQLLSALRIKCLTSRTRTYACAHVGTSEEVAAPGV